MSNISALRIRAGRSIGIAARLGAAGLLLALTGFTAPSLALDIKPDPKLFQSTQTMQVTQSDAKWNLSHLDAKASGGDGVVAWALLGPTDLPASSKVRTAWLEREIFRMHEKLGLKEKISIRMPRHFEPSSIGPAKAFDGEYELVYPDRAAIYPIHIVVLAQGRGRLVILGVTGKDDIIAKAAGGFAHAWAERLAEGQ